MSTLDVLAVGLVAIAFFETVLGILRTYLFFHTTNRIDVELGARLFRHLPALPIGLFPGATSRRFRSHGFANLRISATSDQLGPHADYRSVLHRHIHCSHVLLFAGTYLDRPRFASDLCRDIRRRYTYFSVGWTRSFSEAQRTRPSFYASVRFRRGSGNARLRERGRSLSSLYVTDWDQLSKQPLPGIAPLRSGSFLLLGKVTGNEAIVLASGAERPTLISRTELESTWDGRLVLITKRHAMITRSLRQLRGCRVRALQLFSYVSGHYTELAALHIPGHQATVLQTATARSKQQLGKRRRSSPITASSGGLSRSLDRANNAASPTNLLFCRRRSRSSKRRRHPWDVR